jgi:hypothetical protein
MDVLAIILSLIAIVIAYIALQRTGGLKDIRQQMDHLSSKTEDVAKGARDTTADILQRLEHMVRGAGTGTESSDKDEKPSPPHDTGSKQ